MLECQLLSHKLYIILSRGLITDVLLIVTMQKEMFLLLWSICEYGDDDGEDDYADNDDGVDGVDNDDV